MDKPLEGIKVLELADYVSAPLGARLLADLGADVIKIERATGNVWRVTGTSYRPKRFTVEEENPVFDIYNTGKRNIVLDLKSEDGMAAMMKMLKTADVFVTNNRPAALKRLGLHYEQLCPKIPRLIYAIGLGYGEEGPDANEPAFDTTAFWTRTGFIRDMAPTDGNYMPVFPPSSAGDTITGITMMGEICAALFRRERTGKGDVVKSSLYHNGIFTFGTMQIACQRPFGISYPCSRAVHGLPNGYYKTKDDDWIFVSSGYAPALVPKVFAMIGHPELTDDERFNNFDNLVKHWGEFYQILTDAFLQKTCAEWIALGKEMDVPTSRVNHFADISEDEQAWANNYVQYVEYPNGHKDVIASSPIEMDSVGPLHTVPAHAIGQDTEEVLREYGISQ